MKFLNKSEEDNYTEIDDDLYEKLKEETGITDRSILSKIPPQQLDTIKDLLGELDDLELKEKQIDEDTKYLEQQENEFNEQKYWDEENELEFRIKTYQEEMAQRVNRYKSIDKHYNFLKTLNVLNDVFKIEIDGEYGTISGFRLGPVNSRGITIEGDEINAAMGQWVLLLSTIAIKTEFKLNRIELIPMGDSSKIIHTGENDKKFTYHFNFNWKNSFNSAMKVYLKGLNLLCSHFNRSSNIPKKEKRFEGEPIKISADHLEECKYMLERLKWLIYMTQIDDRVRQELSKNS